MWKVISLHNRAFWWLSLVSGTSHEFESWANYLARLYILSCSAPIVTTLQFPTCFTLCHFGNLPVARSSCEAPLYAHILSFFTLSHIQLLHNFHLNTGYLFTEIQANLVRNKTNTWLNKFNLTKRNYILRSWIGHVT